MQLFPNPTNNVFNLKSNFLIVKVEIFNQQGQMVETLQAQNKEISVKIEHLPKGLYYLKTHLNNGKIGANKLIVQ